MCVSQLKVCVHVCACGSPSFMHACVCACEDWVRARFGCACAHVYLNVRHTCASHSSPSAVCACVTHFQVCVRAACVFHSEPGTRVFVS